MFGSRYDLTRIEAPLPDWVVVGESVLIRPYSYSGVIAYVGPTDFASGNWIGVELDAPTGNFTELYNEILLFFSLSLILLNFTEENYILFVPLSIVMN